MDVELLEYLNYPLCYSGLNCDVIEVSGGIIRSAILTYRVCSRRYSVIMEYRGLL